jgi:hypothetical protein
VSCTGSSSPTLTNCIVWGNTFDSVCGNLSHCLTDQDPLFVNPGHWDDNGTPDWSWDDVWIPGNYRLQPGSPAIDAGTSEGAPATDLEGTQRPQGAGFDIGAYEFMDCDGNGTHDRLDIIAGTHGDCNGNWIPDPCDIASGSSGDVDSNGIPDECLPPGGLRLPGDATGDGRLDISDAVGILGFLFLGNPKQLPCGDGSRNDPANKALVDWQSDGRIDVSDAVATITFLFLGGERHARAVPGAEKSCVRIEGCPDQAGCR